MALHFFILIHLTAIGFWSLPPFLLRNKINNFFQPYMIFSGLWQGWDMFSPNPQRINFHLNAEITYQDGTKKDWLFPEMQSLGYFRRYQKERYRKWRERVRQDDYSKIWPDTARWIARQNYDPKNIPPNPPKTIVLSRHWSDIPPPTQALYQPLPKAYEHTNHYNFFTYQVLPEDLREVVP